MKEKIAEIIERYNIEGEDAESLMNFADGAEAPKFDEFREKYEELRKKYLERFKNGTATEVAKKAEEESREEDDEGKYNVTFEELEELEKEGK